jgi:hypothetical protein
MLQRVLIAMAFSSPPSPRKSPPLLALCGARKLFTPRAEAPAAPLLTINGKPGTRKLKL